MIKSEWEMFETTNIFLGISYDNFISINLGSLQGAWLILREKCFKQVSNAFLFSFQSFSFPPQQSVPWTVCWRNVNKWKSFWKECLIILKEFPRVSNLFLQVNERCKLKSGEMSRDVGKCELNKKLSWRISALKLSTELSTLFQPICQLQFTACIYKQ